MKIAYYVTSATLFLFVAALHAFRSLLGFSILIEGREIPFWLSWVIATLLVYLAFRGYRRAWLLIEERS